LEITYTTWLNRIFGQPASADPPDVGSVSPALVVAYVSRLFARCRTDLDCYDDAQIAKGLWYVFSTGNSDYTYYLYDRGIDWSERAGCMRSILRLYHDCFAIRCLDTTAHSHRADNPVNGICFMLWDVFPSGGWEDTTDRERSQVDRELIGVMAGALEVPHNACRESALHGLSHWESADPQRVHAIVDDWLSRDHDVPRALIEYAKAARNGQVQ
jgi:hypothetical protein